MFWVLKRTVSMTCTSSHLQRLGITLWVELISHGTHCKLLLLEFELKK